MLGQYKRAVFYLEKSIKLDDQDPFVYALLGRAYRSIKEYALARLHLQKAKEIFESAGYKENARRIEEALLSLAKEGKEGKNE